MPLLEGGCAWGGASALPRVPGFLHGLSPPLAPSSYFLPFLACPRKLFGKFWVFCFSWHPLGDSPGAGMLCDASKALCFLIQTAQWKRC